MVSHVSESLAVNVSPLWASMSVLIKMSPRIGRGFFELTTPTTCDKRGSHSSTLNLILLIFLMIKIYLLCNILCNVAFDEMPNFSIVCLYERVEA